MSKTEKSIRIFIILLSIVTMYVLGTAVVVGTGAEQNEFSASVQSFFGITLESIDEIYRFGFKMGMGYLLSAAAAIQACDGFVFGPKE